MLIKNKNIKLSVIMPSKNEVEGIAYALEAWTGICEGLDCEIIVVDDSDDETPEIVQQYMERYKSIKLIKGEGRGVGAARNLGFKHSTGEIIRWTDADGNLESLNEGLVKRRKRWLYSVLESFEDEEVDIVFSPGELWITDSILADGCSIQRIDFDRSSEPVAYRKSVFRGLPISEGITVGEDMDSAMKAMRDRRKEACTSEPIYFFAPVFTLKHLISSHLWYGEDYLAFLKKHKKRGFVNVVGCLGYFAAVLLIPLAIFSWLFIFPFIFGVFMEYARQLKKFNICREKNLLSAWFFIPFPAYVQRVAFSVGFIAGMVKNIVRRFLRT